MNSIHTVCKQALLIGLLLNILPAQDAAAADPDHYKVVLENDQVRVLRISYGPHEKSVMHEHKPGVLVFLTDGEGSMTFADGRKEDFTFKAGGVGWENGTKHRLENTLDIPHELILVELK